MDLEQQFDDAVERVQLLPAQPNHVQLKLYGLFKQARNGDVTGKRPGALNIRGRAKYDAWAARKGMTQDAARQEYIEYVEELGG